MAEHSRFKDLRERVALKWARRALAALAALTARQDSPPRQPGFDYDTHRHEPIAPLQGPNVVDPFAVHVAPYEAPKVAPEANRVAWRGWLSDGAKSRREIAHRATWIAHRATWIARRDALADRISSAELAGKKVLYPAAYVPEQYVPREVAASTDEVVQSTKYVREIGVDDEGNRLVTWKADSQYVLDADTDPVTFRGVRRVVDLERSSRLALHDLERQADDLLRAADVDEHFSALVTAHYLGTDPPPTPKLLRLDVIDPLTRMLTVAPDAAAFRGVNRYRQPSPVRYHEAPAATYSLSGDYTAPSADIAAENVIGTPTDDVTQWKEYRTDVTRRLFVREPNGSPQTAMTNLPRRVVKRDADSWWWELSPEPRKIARPITTDAGRAFVGFRKITTGAKIRNQRKASARKSATAIKRGESVGSRGVARTGWTLSDRSLTRAWSRADAGQAAVATILVQILTTSTHGAPISLGESFTAETDGVQVWRITEHGPSRGYSLQAFARRAALAREDVA